MEKCLKKYGSHGISFQIQLQKAKYVEHFKSLLKAKGWYMNLFVYVALHSIVRLHCCITVVICSFALHNEAPFLHHCGYM